MACAYKPDFHSEFLQCDFTKSLQIEVTTYCTVQYSIVKGDGLMCLLIIYGLSLDANLWDFF
jgi:hypothetical protein